MAFLVVFFAHLLLNYWWPHHWQWSLTHLSEPPPYRMISSLLPWAQSLKEAIPPWQSNYRPISLFIPDVSKLLEKQVLEQLTSHLDNNHVLPPEQFACRPNSSTEDALTLVHDGRQPRTSALAPVWHFGISDMCKAFDRVLHQKLLTDHCEIGAVAWHGSRTTWRVVRSSFALELRKATVTTAPEEFLRAVFWALCCFLFYVRRIPSLLRLFIDHTILFADDVSFDCSRDSITDITTCLTQALRVLVPWCTERSLSVNMDKTHTMLIHPKGTPGPSAQMEVSFNGHTLTQVSRTRFLSFIIDDALFWTEHINALSRKVRPEDRCPLALWTLTGLQVLISRCLYYITVIQPDLLYGASAFYLF